MFFSRISVIYLIFISISEIPCSFAKGDVDERDDVKRDEDPLEVEYGEVVFSSMLFRHGARHRVFKYPHDENEDYYKKRGWGLLTQTGKIQIYELGEWARARYYKLLKQTPYDSEVLHAQSTLSDRTISSAQLFLAGFYPPATEGEQWKENLNWQPIPVYSTPKAMDKMLLLEKYCSRYNLEMMRVNNSPELQAYYEKYQHVFDILKQEAGIKFEDGDIATAINEVVHMRDNLMIDSRNNLDLPKWSVDIYPKDIEPMSMIFFKIQTYNHEMKRLKGGLLVKNIRDDMIRRRDETTSRKRFQLYSGHDTTIAVLLNTLDVFDNERPLYGSMVLIELRKKIENKGEQQYYVTIFYKNGDTNTPKQLNMPDCKNPCTLDAFVAATEKLIPSDWENECEHLEPDYNTILF